MKKRQLIILCTIGSKSVNFKCITSVKVDRNFSDIGNKFSIDLIDSPEVTTYDLELYMNAGYRDIDIKYGDLGTNKLTSFSGTIWDYTNTFVGNKKKLTITGICDRYTENNSGVSKTLYNIDWNTYVNKREDESKPFGAITLENLRVTLNDKSSYILNDDYRKLFFDNSKKLTLTGPSGNTINLPIPESFFSTSNIPEDRSNYDKSAYSEFYSLVEDPDKKYWGHLRSAQTTVAEVAVNFDNPDKMELSYYDNDGNLVAYKKNSKSDYYYVWLPFIIEYDNTKYQNKVSVPNSPYASYADYSSEKLLDLPDDFELIGYNGTIFNAAGIPFPVKDEDKTVGDKTYHTIVDKNGNVVGWRKDGYTPETQHGVTPDKNPVNFAYIKFKDSFFKLSNSRKVSLADLLEERTNTTSKEVVYDDATDYWYYFDENNNIRGFLFNNVFYLQANVNEPYYGGAGIVRSGHGVDISWIVKQLALLEGWKIDEKYITQTELVPDSDAFIMQNQSAADFIRKNLIPKAITPAGQYTDKNGNQIIVKQPQGGFGLFFDEKGFVHFQPISQTNLEVLDINDLGYNIPNSPTISFQVNTKGTAFYNFQNAVINTTSITSGVETSQVEVASTETAEEINKTIGHNDTFDAWLGLTYDTVQKKAVGTSGNNESVSGVSVQNKAYKLAQNALISSPITKLNSSGTYNKADVTGNITKAIQLIQDFTITANMTMWGDYRIKPAGIISITNMVTGGKGNSNIPQPHPSSGKYMIQEMTDTISQSEYIQSLNLLRFTGDLNRLINPYNIDYTQRAKTYSKSQLKISKITDNASYSNVVRTDSKLICTDNDGNVSVFDIN